MSDPTPKAPFPLSAPVEHVFPTLTPAQIARVVGDVRAGSQKRVASAVGEGSTAIALVHQVLAE